MMGSSNQLNEGEIEYLSLILGIINDQNWKALGHAMLDNPYAFQSFARTISNSSELNGLTILHACVRFNPPPHLIKILLELVPESPSCVDCLQRSPLHVAVGTRASFPLIKVLADAFPRACDIQDEDGKTPLHMACDSACELFEGDGDSTRDPPSYDVVETLLQSSPLSVLVEDLDDMSPLEHAIFSEQASPLSVLVEDLDDMSALEHAIFSDAPIQVVKLLQNATRKQCLAQQELNGSIKKSTPSLASPPISVPELESSAVTVVPARKEEFSGRRSYPRNRALAA
ncbi:hypothetical protein ACHAXR_002989 [Thalassiosira sp. AJA248-18]